MKHDKFNTFFTPDQGRIVDEYVKHHGLDPSQISFEGGELTPIFDHNAVSVLSLRLTDIADISITSIEQDETGTFVYGDVVLPDGRKRGAVGACSMGETLGNGEKVKNDQVCLGVATSRFYRQGIRNVGVNLHAAHQNYLQTGQIAGSHLREDPRKANYAEVHILATQLDLIVDGDKSKYHEYLGENYDGRMSASDLNDVELHRLLVQFRSLARLGKSKIAA